MVNNYRAILTPPPAPNPELKTDFVVVDDEVDVELLPVITVSPSLAPDLICMFVSEEIPVSTSTSSSDPFFSIFKYVNPFCVVSETVGTYNASATVSIIIFAVTAIFGNISEDSLSNLMFAV
jgi:hypothetical protein